MTAIAAERITLTPEDASSLHKLGLRVTAEIIPSGQNRDEKVELLQLPLGTLVLGETVKIDYNISKRGRIFAAPVNYTVTDIQPPNADHVGKTTIVKIEDESQATSSDEFLNKLVRQILQNRLLALMDDIGLAEKDDLNADLLRVEVASIERQLLRH